MATDLDILKKGYERENDTRDPRLPQNRNWESRHVGAKRGDITRLRRNGLIFVDFRIPGLSKYKLTLAGRRLVEQTIKEECTIASR